MQYKKGDTLHFIGQPSMDLYKHANMEKSIGKMGFTIKMIDHDKTLMKEVDQILRDHIKAKGQKDLASSNNYKAITEANTGNGANIRIRRMGICDL